MASVSEAHGYEDGWEPDGCFAYFGEGQKGDMKFIKGNRAILDHQANGKSLLLFETGHKAGVRFIDEMECVSNETRRAPDTEGKERDAIVFKLLPIGVSVDNGGEESIDPTLEGLSLKDLREKAMLSVRPGVSAEQRRANYRVRSHAIRRYALKRAAGVCENCMLPAPFKNAKGEPFLEVHHIDRLGDGGPDRPDAVAGICPNCHRRCHLGHDGSSINAVLKAAIIKKEAELELVLSGRSGG